MLDVHSGVGQSLPAESFDGYAIQRDGHRSLVGAPASNWLAIHNRWHVFDAPAQRFEILWIAVLQVFAGLLHHRFKKAQPGYPEVK